MSPSFSDARRSADLAAVTPDDATKAASSKVRVLRVQAAQPSLIRRRAMESARATVSGVRMTAGIGTGLVHYRRVDMIPATKAKMIRLLYRMESVPRLMPTQA